MVPSFDPRSLMTKDDCVEIGYISQTHGIKGLVKAVFDVHDLEEYRDQTFFFLAQDGEPIFALDLTHFQPGNKYVILGFEGVNSREEAQSLVGATLYFPIAALPSLPEDQFYFFEIMGYQVVDEHLGELGTLTQFLDIGPQELLIMEYKGNEVLIPVVDAFIKGVDKGSKRLLTALPKGLLDLYLNEDQVDTA